jgi:hypothetical protein
MLRDAGKMHPCIFTKEMQIKTTLRFHLTPVRTQMPTNVSDNVGEKEPSYTASGNIKQYGGSSKNQK